MFGSKARRIRQLEATLEYVEPHLEPARAIADTVAQMSKEDPEEFDELYNRGIANAAAREALKLHNAKKLERAKDPAAFAVAQELEDRKELDRRRERKGIQGALATLIGAPNAFGVVITSLSEPTRESMVRGGYEASIVVALTASAFAFDGIKNWRQARRETAELDALDQISQSANEARPLKDLDEIPASKVVLQLEEAVPQQT